MTTNLLKSKQGQPTRVKELNTGIEFESIRIAERHFNIKQNVLSSKLRDTNSAIECEGYVFKKIIYEIIEVYSGKKFETTVDAGDYFETSSSSVSASIRLSKTFVPRHGKYYGKNLKFERRIATNDDDFLDKLLNKKVVDVSTSAIMTVESAAKKYNVAPYKINECINFGYAINYNGTRVHFKNANKESSNLVIEEDLSIKGDIKSKEINIEEKTFDIFTNKQGEVIIIQNNNIIKKIKSAEDLLNAFDNKTIKIDTNEEKIICYK